MCFKSSSPPTPKAPPPPATGRDANLDALQKQRQASFASSESGFPSTVKFGKSSDAGAANPNASKTVLGG